MDYFPEPVPFRLKMPGKESLDLTGISQVGFKVTGLLHLGQDTLTLEWAIDKTTERIDVKGVTTEVDHMDYEELAVPISWIAEARLTRWPSRIVLRARRLHAFDGVPAARPGTVSLKIPLRHRKLAAEMVEAIQGALTDVLEYTDPGMLPSGESTAERATSESEP